MMLMSILFSISALGMRAYARVQEHRGATREMVAIMRNVQVRAATEGRPYRCVFTDSATNTNNETLVCRRGTSGGPVVNTYTLSTYLNMTDNTFPSKTVVFTARGTADDGSVIVRRASGSSKTYRIEVEGLTGRVFSDV